VENKIVDALDFFTQKGASLSDPTRVEVFVQLWESGGLEGAA
jgi:hypothetical protein